ncbi:ATPase, T2SS/T4P/T4SS family, partial [Modestobacter versicolor]
MSDSAPPLVERVRARLASGAGAPSPVAVAALVREEAGGLLGDGAVLTAVRAATDELSGAGVLEPLLRLPGVTDVLVNGPASVWVDRGAGLEPVDVRFPDEAAVRRLAVRLAAAAGRRLDDAAPWVDAGLPDGTRLHAVLPPVSGSGTCLSLRVLRRAVLSFADLADRGAFPGAAADLLTALVQARLAFLVTGGTGTGKTTVLSALLGLAGQHERLVLCEDAPELAPLHPHVVRLLTRPPNVE